MADPFGAEVLETAKVAFMAGGGALAYGAFRPAISFTVFAARAAAVVFIAAEFSIPLARYFNLGAEYYGAIGAAIGVFCIPIVDAILRAIEKIDLASIATGWLKKD